MMSFLKGMTKFQLVLVGILCAVCILLSNHLWQGDLLLHSDIARDLLVLEDIVQTRSPTLIGPRSGGVAGVFHGPLWYYTNLLPFILTHGDPVLMGWVWWAFGVIAAGTFFYICYRETKKKTVSLLASICFALAVLPTAVGPTNGYFADLFSFLVFALLLSFYRKPTILTAALGWLLLGILVQFQMAFAVPLALVWFVAFVWKVFKTKKFLHLLAAAAFFPPLISFFLFDVRHDWLQVRAVLRYFSESSGHGNTLFAIAKDRGRIALMDGLSNFGMHKWISPVVLAVMAFFSWKTRDAKLMTAGKLFVFLFTGWWIVTLAFSGPMWIYYFSPFLGIYLLSIALIAGKSKKALLLLSALTLVAVISARGSWRYYPERFDSSSWRLLSRIASESLSEQGMGYFVYSQDQFAYPLKYAFMFYAKKHLELNAASFAKRNKTVLVKAADDPNNPFMTSQYWQYNRVRIAQDPVETIHYPFGFVLERYLLDEEALAVPIDPNMITDLHFR